MVKKAVHFVIFIFEVYSSVSEIPKRAYGEGEENVSMRGVIGIELPPTWNEKASEYCTSGVWSFAQLGAKEFLILVCSGKGNRGG